MCHTSLIDYLQHEGGVPCPFVAVRDVYQITASKWVVVNTCFQRELCTTERYLKHDASRLKAFEDTSKVSTKCAVVLHFTETSSGNDKTHVASTVGNTKACHVPLPVP